MTQKAWSDAVSERVRAAFIAARGEQSAQDIADETAQLGHPMTRSVIANFENGRKKTLDVCELMILAAACGVPPITLLYPTLPDGECESLPGVTGSAFEGVRWFAGEDVVEEPGTDLGRLLKLTRTRWAMEIERMKIRIGVDNLFLPDADRDGEEFKKAVLEIGEVADQIERLNRRIDAIPGAVVSTKKGTKK